MAAEGHRPGTGALDKLSFMAGRKTCILASDQG